TRYHVRPCGTPAREPRRTPWAKRSPGQRDEVPYRLGGVPGEVVVHERDHRHALPQYLDGPRVLSHLRAPVDDDVVQRRGQGVPHLTAPEQAEIGERTRHHVQPLDHAERARHPDLIGQHSCGAVAALEGWSGVTAVSAYPTGTSTPGSHFPR